MNMKKILVLALTLLLLAGLPLSMRAADLNLVHDQSDVLSPEEYRELNQRALDLIKAYEFDVAVVVLDDMGSSDDAYEFAKYVYREYNYGQGEEESGVMLLLSLEERDYALIAYGYGNDVFTDHGKDALLNRHVLPLLKDNNFYEAFSAYFDVAEEYLEMAQNGDPFDIYNDPLILEHQSRRNFWIKLGVTLLLPLLLAGGTCLVWARQMKTARVAKTAGSYVVPGSLILNRSEDTFLYQTQTRRTIKSESSGGTSRDSSGFSGRSGKF